MCVHAQVASMWTLTVVVAALVLTMVASTWLDVYIYDGEYVTGLNHGRVVRTSIPARLQVMVGSEWDWGLSLCDGVPGWSWVPSINRWPDGRLEFSCPVYIPLALVVAPTSVLWWYHLRRRATGCCVSCGYDLTGNLSGRCPECGEAILQDERRASHDGGAFTS